MLSVASLTTPRNREPAEIHCLMVSSPNTSVQALPSQALTSLCRFSRVLCSIPATNGLAPADGGLAVSAAACVAFTNVPPTPPD